MGLDNTEARKAAMLSRHPDSDFKRFIQWCGSGKEAAVYLKISASQVSNLLARRNKITREMAIEIRKITNGKVIIGEEDIGVNYAKGGWKRKKGSDGYFNERITVSYKYLNKIDCQ